VVLRVSADTGRSCTSRAVLLRQTARATPDSCKICGADAAGAGSLHRSVRAPRESRVAGGDARASPSQSPRRCSAPAIWLLFNDNAHLGAGPHLKVRAAQTGGAQNALAVFQRQPAFLVDFEVTTPSLLPVLKSGVWDAGLVGFGRRPASQRRRCFSRHSPQLWWRSSFGRGRPCSPHQLGAVPRAPWRRLAPVVVLQHEVGRAVVPGPAHVAGELGPLVVVSGLATHVDHAVDAGAAAQRLAAQSSTACSRSGRVGFGCCSQSVARVANAVR
jgi:hypothetical protein